MLIKIDSREESLKVECIMRIVNYKHVRIESCVLDLGDIIIYDDNGLEIAIIERKTLNDLAASIKDGRYAEQSFRLNGCSVNNHNVYYLVEGCLASYNPKKTRLEKKALLSSFTTISYFKGFSLHRTEDIGESAEWLLSFADKIRRSGHKVNNTEDTTEDTTKDTTKMDYINVASRVKKENITKENIGAIMLSQIPSVSSSVAIAVMKKYDNIITLIKELEINQYALTDIYTETKQGKQRKISKTSQTNIYKFLLPNTESEISVNTA
jgi:ERCC4-type nuclease